MRDDDLLGKVRPRERPLCAFLDGRAWVSCKPRDDATRGPIVRVSGYVH